MKLTVGPLSPAVYWRRRALVLGALLAVVTLISYSCSGRSGADDRKNNAAKSTKSPTAAASSTAPTLLSPTVSEPPVVPVNPGSGGTGTGSGNTGNSGGGTATGVPCSDSEIAVVPEAENATVRQGVPTKLFIKIKNLSGRTCVRDVGADMQELYIQQGGVKHWSSDSCEKRTGNDVVTFPPNHEVSYWLTWDGKSTAQGCANRPWLAKGSYQLYGRVGTKISEPLTITVTG